MRAAHVTVDLGPEVAAAGRAFWSTALGWAVGEPWPGHPELRSLEPPGDAPSWVHLQDVDAGARIHLDLSVDDVAATAERLVGLGATEVRRTEDWLTMRSPGGFDFCLVAAGAPEPGSRPAVTTWPDGHRTRLVQVCIDCPPEHHQAEETFWRQATGWRWDASGADSEFTGKLFPDPSSPVHLLLQRLGEDETGHPTRAHIDLGTDDLDAEVARLELAGARRLWPGDGFVALEDPAGMAFCVTGNPPERSTAD
ncbi:VOC family protein [Desertihabitans brevis]|uniref:VOC family protein n=1 Tax=Desertihabitans brevis TaxID=2268447 RepID=A0A367YW27_9ACTN|nr:VOC family protein [Desertihabitans brevis]RCK69171.1 VOC family protein [Desertihabitans brevis]